MREEEILVTAAVLLTIFILPVIPGWVARRKNRSFVRWYSISFLLSFMPTFIPGFIVGLLALYMLPPLEKKVSSSEEQSLLFRRWRRLAIPAYSAGTAAALCCIGLWLASHGFFTKLSSQSLYGYNFVYVSWGTSTLLVCSLLAAVVYQGILVYTRRTDTLVDFCLVWSAVVFMLFSIISTAVWANEAWGTYWGWDPKETWSAIMFGAIFDALALNAVGRVLEPSRKGLVVSMTVNSVVLVAFQATMLSNYYRVGLWDLLYMLH